MFPRAMGNNRKSLPKVPYKKNRNTPKVSIHTTQITQTTINAFYNMSMLHRNFIQNNKRCMKEQFMPWIILFDIAGTGCQDWFSSMILLGGPGLQGTNEEVSPDTSRC